MWISNGKQFRSKKQQAWSTWSKAKKSSKERQCWWHTVNKGKVVRDVVREVMKARPWRTLWVIQREEPRGITEGFTSHLEIRAKKRHDLIYILTGSLQLLCWTRLKRTRTKRGRPIRKLLQNPGESWLTAWTRVGVLKVVKSCLYLKSKIMGFAGWLDIECEKKQKWLQDIRPDCWHCQRKKDHKSSKLLGIILKNQFGSCFFKFLIEICCRN